MRTYRRRLITFAIAPIALALVAAAPARARMLHLAIDPLTSTMTATVDKPLSRMNGSVSGTFQIISGKIDGDPQNPGAGSHVELVIDPTSYSSGLSHRDNAVLSQSLQTSIYSDIRFAGARLDDVKIDAPGAMGSAIVVGNLTMHGVTRELRVPVDATLSPDREFSADGSVTFDYTEFGIAPPTMMFGALSAAKEVTIEFRIIARPAGAATPTPSP